MTKPKPNTTPEAPDLKRRSTKLRADLARPSRGAGTTAAEALSGEPPETDWHSPPPGFMAYPAIDPQGFVVIREGLRMELERLYGIAVAEFRRRTEWLPGGMNVDRTEAAEARLRGYLFLAPLTAAVDPHSDGAQALAALDRPVSLNGQSALVSAMFKGWTEWAACSGLDESDKGVAAYERAYARRGELLTAAEALPATRDNLIPKALALAWIEHAHLWKADCQRDDYATDGRLALDIDTIMTGEPPETPTAIWDPFLVAMEAARTADRAVSAFSERTRDRKPEGWFQEEAKLVAEQSRTKSVALAIVPRTRAGQLALADYVAELMQQHGMLNGDPPEPYSPIWADAYTALSAALRAPIKAEDTPGPDLSKLTIPQLGRLYETWNGIHQHIMAAGNAPCFWEDERRYAYTPAGNILDREYDRASRFIGAIAREVEQRQPASKGDRDERLNVLVQYELECGGKIEDRALLAEITEAWGG